MMAGTISFSLSQQLDELGQPLANGRLYIIQAGTTSTPQNAYQDSALTLALPNPIPLDAAGRIPQFFLNDGNIKIRLTDQYGTTQVVADGILVIGPSGGGGGGGSVDPTTVMQPGDIKFRHGTEVLSGFVRANGRTIGSATSGATERANADCFALFGVLYIDPSLVVSGGRGASVAADWAANKTIALPDIRGRAPAGLTDMGNVPNGILTGASFSFGTPTILGSMLGAVLHTLTADNVPPITSVNGAQPISVTSTAADIHRGGSNDNFTSVGGVGGPYHLINQSSVTSVGNNNISVASTGTNGSPFDASSPFFLLTIYIKL